jgi:putative transposase
LINKAYKYRIYPNNKQKAQLNKNFGCVRKVYNLCLDKKIKEYNENNKSLSCFELGGWLAKEIKTQKEYEYLNEAVAQTLQMSIRNLDNAFTQFFREKKGFPKFKSKKNKRDSIQFPQLVKIDIENNKVSIPKCKWIKCKFDNREIIGKIKTCTVSRDKCNNYFISILTEIDKDFPTKKKIKEKTSIGLDLGIKDFCVLSSGIKIHNPKTNKKFEKRINKQHRILSKKVNGSKNKEKQRLKLAKLYQHRSNIKNDFLHKYSYKIVSDKQIDTIIIEDLNVSDMLKNKKLSPSIQDVSWYEFTRMLEYKCEREGKNLIRIGRFDPSSKMCSICGTINSTLSLKDREWVCTNCNTKHDRDINAAKNIKTFGLQKQNLIGMESPKFKPAEISNVDERLRKTKPKKHLIVESGNHQPLLA